MRAIATKTSMMEVKRLNINVELKLHNAFKSAAAAEGREMTELLLEFIRNYVEKQAAASKKGGRQ